MIKKVMRYNDWSVRHPKAYAVISMMVFAAFLVFVLYVDSKMNHTISPFKW